MTFFLKWWVSDLVKIHWFWMSTYVKMINEKQCGLVGKWNMSSGVMGWGGLVVFSIGTVAEKSKEMSFPRVSVQSLRGSLAACEDRTWESPTLQGWQRRRRTLQTRCGSNHNHGGKFWRMQCHQRQESVSRGRNDPLYQILLNSKVKQLKCILWVGWNERSLVSWLEQIQEKKVNTTQEFSPWRRE